MTRTYMLELAKTVKTRAGRPYAKTPLLTTYFARYLNFPIYCVYNNYDVIVAIFYKRVFYAVNAASREEAIELKDMLKIHHCLQKVFLYPNNKHKLYIDQHGVCYYDESTDPRKNDYSDVIPLRTAYRAR